MDGAPLVLSLCPALEHEVTGRFFLGLMISRYLGIHLSWGIVIVLAGHHPLTGADGKNVWGHAILSKSVPEKVGTKLAEIDVF